ncbi:hypothetical protein Ddc_10244 [Ditylenchus destructor]|nr:hypothetical protein Ddc_10244 [Ditylenchus destructor]
MELKGEESETKPEKEKNVQLRKVHICNANGTPLFKHPESNHNESDTPEEQKLDNTLVFEKGDEKDQAGFKAKLSEQFKIPLDQIFSIQSRSTHVAISNIRDQKCSIPTHLFAKFMKGVEKYLNWGERHRGYMFVESKIKVELFDYTSKDPLLKTKIIGWNPTGNGKVQTPKKETNTFSIERGISGAELTTQIVDKFQSSEICVKGIYTLGSDLNYALIRKNDIINHVNANKLYVEYDIAPKCTRLETKIHVCNTNGTPLYKNPDPLDNMLKYDDKWDDSAIRMKLAVEFGISNGKIISVSESHDPEMNKKCHTDWAEGFTNIFTKSDGYLFVDSDSQTAETTLKFKRGKTGADLADEILHKFGPATIALKDMSDGRKAPIGYQDVINHVYGNKVYVEYQLAPLATKFEYRRRRTMTMPQDKDKEAKNL